MVSNLIYVNLVLQLQGCQGMATSLNLTLHTYKA